jgi:hypothetical protein
MGLATCDAVEVSQLRILPTTCPNISRDSENYYLTVNPDESNEETLSYLTIRSTVAVPLIRRIGLTGTCTEFQQSYSFIISTIPITSPPSC